MYFKVFATQSGAQFAGKTCAGIYLKFQFNFRIKHNVKRDQIESKRERITMSEKNVDMSQNNQMYEGTEPYIFISYSHRDASDMLEITRVFGSKNIRFWYDNGLHSGDDWNLIIAEHLEKASICLLLLSSAAASSFYVKNELNFAINHRIPIHTLLLENFSLPIDIEMMLGRIQMIEKSTGYEQRLVEALPSELYISVDSKGNDEGLFTSHPLFKIDAEKFNRQGTISFLGHHKELSINYLCIIIGFIM